MLSKFYGTGESGILREAFPAGKGADALTRALPSATVSKRRLVRSLKTGALLAG